MKESERFLSKIDPFIIAVDGEAASGKGTLSKKIAKNYGFFYCPTSILYRKLADAALAKNLTELEHIIKEAKSLDNLEEDESLYTEEVSRKSSEIAQIKEVRDALNFFQKQILKTHKRVLMEGRDIGTVIAPDADIKLYIKADINLRAERRFGEQISKNPLLTLNDVKNDLIKRDMQDKNRENAPLCIAKDAIILDSSFWNIDEFYEETIKSIIEKCGRNYGN